jgi:steroid delta-isomerase-like uncharacterized protein
MMTQESTALDPEANKAIVRRLFEEAWNKSNIDAAEPHLAPEARFHFHGRSRTTDLQDLRRLVSAWRQAFPDLRFEIHAIVAEDDLVAVRLVFSGTQAGAWKEIAPTGRAIEVTQMMFFRLRGGRVVEMWEDFDEYGMRQQLGALD